MSSWRIFMKSCCCYYRAFFTFLYYVNVRNKTENITVLKISMFSKDMYKRIYKIFTGPTGVRLQGRKTGLIF